jgi:RNA polymerase sigma factor (sigma-70 family)
MNIQDVLKQYPFIQDDMRDIQKEMYVWQEMQEDLRQRALKAQVYSDMPHSTDVGNPTLEKTIAIIDKYQENINECIRKLDELDKLKKWLDKAYTELPEQESRVLKMYYNKNMSLNKIGECIRKRWNTVRSILQEAERKVKNIIG